MEPIPETVKALADLTRHGDTTLAASLLQLARDVETIVPEVVGLSLSLVEEGLVFTLTATGETTAELDGVQYLGGGPCEQAALTNESHQYRAGDPSSEEQWAMFARATAAAGVASTLSLPVVLQGTIVAGVNLYASSPNAFDGRLEELAQVCGASADNVSRNADLGFSTRFAAAETPGRIDDDRRLDQAAGLLMSLLDLELDQATARLQDAARRAGISDVQLARALLNLDGNEPA